MTTTVVHTIGPSGADYTTVGAWEAAQQRDLVAADEIEVGELIGSVTEGANLVISGWTTSATNYVELRARADLEHSGIWGDGVRVSRASATYTQIYTISQNYTRVTGLELYGTGNFTTLIRNSTGNARFDRIMARHGSSTGATTFDQLNSGNSCTIINSVLIGNTTINVYSSLTAYNSICSNAWGLTGSGGSGSRYAYNCIAMGGWTGTTSLWTGGSNNACNSAAGFMPGTSDYGSDVTSADFINSAGYDYHLASGSGLEGAGVNLYGTFEQDIDGDIRPSSGAWSIGIDHYVAAAGGHDVEAENATSQPVASSAAIAQTHQVAASNATSAPTASAAAVSQTHKVAVASASSTPAASAAAITQTHKVSAASATSQPIASSAQISQGSTHLVTGANATSAPAASTAAIRQTHPVGVASSTSTPQASFAAITIPGEGVTLSPEDIAAIADAVWAHSSAVSAHAILDAIMARVTC